MGGVLESIPQESITRRALLVIDMSVEQVQEVGDKGWVSEAAQSQSCCQRQQQNCGAALPLGGGLLWHGSSPVALDEEERGFCPKAPGPSHSIAPLQLLLSPRKCDILTL
jgi:hypothetical protein